ncbi:MAG: aminotransferase class I/II-fold pyridoxal phosphate-dependent enzyme, partial [Muribaculaceae bacterium]|nr:aminotransferase class I/II-fold pyridoxal phosphate-dependent enzyme [Muribaculaceae bacterium]
ICHRHGVIVVSDEIHCELTMPGYSYIPYGTVDSEAIVCLSPSKAFNTAGLQIANIICGDAGRRAAIDRAININEVCDVNPFGVEGLIAAYSADGLAWLEELRNYLYENYIYARDFLAEHLRFAYSMARLEATYLLWLDTGSLGMGAEELEERLLSETGVWVNSGVMYGADGYIRINIACPRTVLADALARLCDGLNGIID